MNQFLETRTGKISFPAYVPVTTFGDKYPLDNLLRPYLPRLADAVMVSYYYAKQIKSGQKPRIPMMVDSGGFFSLYSGVEVKERKKLGVIEYTKDGQIEKISPLDVLELQEEIADVAFTLDFPIPPGMDLTEARTRQKLTINNAHWAIANRRRRDLPLYASIQAWDVPSAKECAKAYVNCGFDGVAIGGLVPRSKDLSLVLSIVEAVRAEIPDLPLHVFGLGHPNMISRLYEAGVNSVDSSSYIKYAASGKLWSNPDLVIEEPTATDRLHLALWNLATATGKTLPLATTEMLFETVRKQEKVKV